MLIELIKKRTSVRQFDKRPIDGDILDQMLESGRLSPSGGNEQAWRFGVITDAALIDTIAEMAYNQKWIKSAPLLVVFCSQIVPLEDDGYFIQNSRFPRWEEAVKKMDPNLYASICLEEHQTKIPATQMSLVALEYGIYSTFISYFNVEEVARLLNLPQDIIPSEIVAFGYPLNPPKPRVKKDIHEIVFYNRFK